MPSLATSTSAVEVVPQNLVRKSIIFLNEDTTDSIFLMRERNATPTVSSTVHDFKLSPGASLAINQNTDGSQAIQERYTCIASANTPRLAYFETEDIKR